MATNGGPPMPLTSAVQPNNDKPVGLHAPPQQSASRDAPYTPTDEYESHGAKRLGRVRHAARSTVWGREWETPASVTLHHPPGDYRDQLPPPMLLVAEQYKDVPKNGDWTFGLLEMWGKRSKVVKSAVHVPCWEAYRLNCMDWRGACFGRTCHQCFWLGVDRTRWARTAYGAGLGREYKVPCSAVPESHYKGRIAALCMFQCCITEAASVGFGQFVAPGGCGFNFAACYTCHSREKIRRKYDLPATFGLPPGFDDCCTHFYCMYCASHQEARELVVRGVDGPGMHVLDVEPEAFSHLPGYQEAIAEREEVRRALMARPPGEFQTMGRRVWNDPGRIGGRARPGAATKAAAGKTATAYKEPLEDNPYHHTYQASQ